jgi:hypothetical protein
MLSGFELSLKHDHEKILGIKELYISLVLENRNLNAAELLQRQLLHHYEHINEYSHSSVWAAYGLGLVLEKKSDSQGAEEAYRSASLRGSICNGGRFPTRTMSMCRLGFYMRYRVSIPYRYDIGIES